MAVHHNKNKYSRQNFHAVHMIKKNIGVHKQGYNNLYYKH